MTRVAVGISAWMFSCLFAGCATGQVEEELPSPGPALTSEMLDAIHSTKVVIGVDLSSQSQATRASTIKTSQSLGMLGVVVDIAMNSAIENNRQTHERQMVEIQNAAINFNFGGHFKTEFESAVRQRAWLHVTSVVREPSPQRGNAKLLATQVKEDAILITDVGYAIVPDLSGFSITAHTVFRLRDPQTGTPAAPVASGNLFQRNYSFQYPLEQPYADKQQASQAWAENNGMMVQRALQVGISDTVRRITDDLETFRELTSPAPLVQRKP